MTELEAINTLLSVIGEAPVDALPSLTKNDITDAALARKTLTEVKRDVLAEGWSWNTDLDYPSTKNANNEFPLPSDTLRVTFLPSSQPHMNYVQRGLKIYDKASASSTLATWWTRSRSTCWCGTSTGMSAHMLASSTSRSGQHGSIQIDTSIAM